jgi:hypothetical protein
MKCVECGREHTAKWYSPKTNPTCASCYRKQYVAKNRDKVAEYYKKYNASDKAVQSRKDYEQTDKGRAARKKAEAAYYCRNPEKMKAKRDTPEQRERLRNHYRNNKGYYKEKTARRSRRLEEASLKRTYTSGTVEVYSAAPENMHVDHIIPLQGKMRIHGKWQHAICGLHVPWNMQYLDGIENKSKNCKVLITEEEYTNWIRDRVQNNNPSVEPVK